MSERIYQVIIGVLVLVILVGGWLMVSNKTGFLANSKWGAAATSTYSDSGAIGATDMSMSSSSSDMQTGTASSGQAQSSSMTEEGAMVSVMDQPAGSQVSVDSVTIAKRAWVAIRRAGGWVIGAELVKAGTTKNVAVTLLRPTVAGDSYDAVLYVDDGDGVFNLHKDTLVTKADGGVLSSAFLAK